MALTKNELQAALQDYDGKSVTILSEVAARYSHEENYVDHIISLIGNEREETSNGASWLVKSHVENGNELAPAQITELIKRICATQDWASQLHICQIIGRLSLAKPQAAKMEKWLTPLLEHKRPFVRAWSLDALCALARQHNFLMPLADTALKAAAKDQASSVKARARNILKKL